MVDLLSRRIEKRVVLLGLDNAGKTTCVYRLLLGKKIDTVPTVGFNSEEVRYNRCNFILWDIGGQAKIRKLWKHYIESADALIFVVDSQDRARLREARAAFKRMLRHKTLRNTVLLIYANKTDYEHSMSPAEIVEGLDVKRVVGDRKWFIQKTCAISGQGLREGLEWLSRALEVHGSSSSSSTCGNSIAAGPKEELGEEGGGEDEGEEGREDEQVAEGLGTPASSSSSMVIKGSSWCGWGWRWRRRGRGEQQPAGSAGLGGGPAGCPRAPEEEATRRRRSSSHSGGGNGNGNGNGHALGKEEEEEREEGREGGGGVQVTVGHSHGHCQMQSRHLSHHEQQKVASGVVGGGVEGEKEEEEEEEETEEDDEEEEVKCSSSSRKEGGKGEALPAPPPLPPVTFTSNTTGSAMAQAHMFG